MAGKRKERANASSNVALSNLKIVLDKCGVDGNRYCFGVHMENKTSIVQENGAWTVSFSKEEAASRLLNTNLRRKHARR